MADNLGNCPICNVKATQICSSCKLVKYCGVEHQKQHWKIHKNDCVPYSISTAKDIGRFLLAKRDIKENTVIFSESPLIVGPKWYLTDQEICNPIVSCVGCFTSVKIGVNWCPKCHWPACDPKCPGLENPKLHGLECSILCLGLGLKHSENIKTFLEYYRTDALVVLKCLMLQKKFKKKWNQLMDMESHEEERLGSELYQDAENRIVSYLLSNYLEPLKKLEEENNKIILTENNASLLHKICGIIETNYMLINLPNGSELTGVFYTACMMEHSCQPNCYFTFDPNDGFKISVISGRNIKQGEHLKIMYSNMLWGTLLREEHLQMTKHFTCKCERCVDPTELGTYFSGLKCMGIDSIPCENGIQLPENPIDRNSEWICNKCPVKLSGDEVYNLLTQMGEEIDGLLRTKPSKAAIETLIDKLSQFLHTNHYHLFNLKHSLIQLYKSNQVSEEILKHKIEMCNELQNICNIFDPYTIRLSLYVAIILYEKYTAIVELNQKLLQHANDKMKCNDEEKRKGLEEIMNGQKLLFQASEVMKKELDTNTGIKLNETINKAISECNILISKYS